LEKNNSLDYETKKEYEITVRIYEKEPVASVDYRGNTHTTSGGKLCQAWEKQDPRKHSFTPSKYKNAGLDHSSCRDPNARGKVWCFTEDGSKEWDYCTQQFTYDAKLTIEITDVNDAPTIQLPKSDLNVYEDAGNGIKIGKPLLGDDEDDKDEVTYAFKDSTEGANTYFSIHSTTGQITVKDASQLDFEGDNTFSPTIVVTDKKGLTAEIVATINILDVKESPEV
jgi:hypothetical protein